MKAYQKRDVKNVERQIRLHLDPVFGQVPVKRLSTAKIQDYIEKRVEAGAAPATVNRELSTLIRGLRLALQQDPPLIGREFKIRKLKEDQYVALRKELPDSQQLALVIAYHVGFRRGELLNIKWIWTAGRFCCGEARRRAATPGFSRFTARWGRGCGSRAPSEI